MSIYQESGFMPALRGKVANSVFQRNRYGRYVRNKTIPINPRTMAQRKVRAFTSELSRIWGSLNDNQRTNWQTRAADYPVDRHGRTYILNGFMFFMMLNRCLQEINEPVVLDFPQIVDPQRFSSFSVDIYTTPGTADINLNITPAINSDTKLRLCATRVIKPGVSNVNYKFHKIGVIDSTFITGDSIKDLYIAKYGAMPSTGDKVYFTIQSTLIASGYSNMPYEARSIAAI